MGMKDLSQLTDDELMNMDPSSFGEGSDSPTEEIVSETTTDSGGAENAATQTEGVETDVVTETPSTDGASNMSQEDDSGNSEDPNPLDVDDRDFLKFDSAPQKKQKQTEQVETTPASKETTDPSLPGSSSEKQAEEKTEPGKEEKTVVAEDGKQTAIDYKQAYEKIMAPFKANGRMIEPRSEEEVIQLMQMGANYTRRMQELASVRKQITMLENNGLLDEERLSFLIDLDKKNPEAIKKLLKDSGIDPLEIDTDTPTNYTAGLHKVTDDEMRFRSTLDTVTALPEGRETISLINSTWDQASKDVLWGSPEIMEVVHEQKSNGVYDRICAEIERQRILGQIPANIPFIQVYKTVGDYLGNQGAFNDVYGTQQPVGTPSQSSSTVTQQRTQTKTPVATRVAAPKQEVTNSRQVASVAGVRNSSSAKADKSSNLAMLNDDEFMKMFAGRV